MPDNTKSEGYVFDIQRYSIHDGPGIRTTVFLKGCPLHCFWCQNPESQKLSPEILFFKDRCTACGRCADVCPNQAVKLNGKISQTDRSRCSGCGQCVEACPNEARKLAGRLMTAEQVLLEVLKDKKFYDNSGGGVTLSGGEPLFQPDFAMDILRKSKDERLHTVVETSGSVPWSHFEKIIDYTDLFLFDIKQIDDGRHQSGTGMSNNLILSNIKKVAGLKKLKVRVPLIPGFNDSREDIQSIARFVKGELGTVEIELLAYNKMGEIKYERLGRECRFLELQSENHVQSLKDLVKGTAE
jgi:pyruvate formate lyase activating enzyme